MTYQLPTDGSICTGLAETGQSNRDETTGKKPEVSEMCNPYIPRLED